ncbi:hypothetical protein GCM10007170_16520 [Arthrobacter liuii]|uniref:Uncharacterized protein n=1 Tax=Arthrobacter liuii TaxID=1476996 RepID=A0ABQ2AQ12_9MICC|nr:hypothetical protein GCM10007170_16520 [Arthrobacter liuii]
MDPPRTGSFGSAPEGGNAGRGAGDVGVPAGNVGHDPRQRRPIQPALGTGATGGSGAQPGRRLGAVRQPNQYTDAGIPELFAEGAQPATVPASDKPAIPA